MEYRAAIDPGTLPTWCGPATTPGPSSVACAAAVSARTTFRVALPDPIAGP